MTSWPMGILVCLVMLVGCAGGHKGNLVKIDPAPQEMAATVTEDNGDDASLTEELSGKRLEELYAKSGIPGWDPGLEAELKQWEHQVKFDVPIQMNKQVRAYLVYFSTERKAIITRYLSRSTRYLPMIKEIFQENGLPDDLAYLAMIESGFNNKAYSSAAACGMWQFIKGTGVRYGLAIDSYVDERRDPEKATRAAANYLLDLYKQFGSWYLAAASYNCGEGRVQRELNQSSHKNFWELSANMCLPSETKNYVPQMIAATIIAKNPEKFGFKNVPYLPPLKYERVKVSEPTSLKAAAAAVNVPVDEIQGLNPELVRGVTPPDSPNYSLNLPPNSKEVFGRNITLARAEHPAVASAPIRTARAPARSSYGSSRAQSSRQTASVSKKSSGRKAQTYAKAAPKQQAAPAQEMAAAKKEMAMAKKGKSPQASAPAPKEDTSPRMASIFGAPASIAKNANSSTGKSKPVPPVASSAKGKSKASAVKTASASGSTGAKKSGEAHLAKKSDAAPKNAAKTKPAKKNTSAVSGKKDKYSKAKSRPLVVSEAR